MKKILLLVLTVICFYVTFFLICFVIGQIIEIFSKNNFAQKQQEKYAICEVLDYEMSVIKDANDIGAKIGDLSDGIRKIKYLSLYECPEDFKIAFETYIEAREKQLKRLEESEDYYNKYMSGFGFIKMALRAITLDLSLFEEMDSEGRASLSNLIDATNDAKAARENVLNVAEKYDVDTSKYKHYK